MPSNARLVRGESAKLWRQEGMTLDRVKTLRRKEAKAAAEPAGVTGIQFWNLGDYPLTGRGLAGQSEAIKGGCALPQSLRCASKKNS